MGVTPPAAAASCGFRIFEALLSRLREHSDWVPAQPSTRRGTPISLPWPVQTDRKGITVYLLREGCEYRRNLGFGVWHVDIVETPRRLIVPPHLQIRRCVVLTDRQSRLLDALTNGPQPADQLDPGEVDVLRRWG
jgi:hypothetical protein